MSKRNILDINTVAALVATVTTLAVLTALAYRFQDIRISSAEVNDILYERLDEYNRAILEDPGVATVFAIAETNPGSLSEESRIIYLTHQQLFFDGWEAAMNYNDAGLFDADRWNVWNSWHIDEVRRRPRFGWTENRQYYSGAFLQHVDDSLVEPRSKSALEKPDKFRSNQD